MSGLIDASILKPELANSLAEGYRQSREERHKREMDRATLATLEQQRESNQLTLERLKQEREMMMDLQSKLKAIGRDPDLNKVFDVFIASGNPDYVMKGYEGKRKLQEQARAEDVLRQYAPEVFPPGPSAPGGTAPGTVAPAGTVNAMAPSAPSSAVPGAPSGTVAPTGTVAPAGTVNAMAPRTEPATEVNALRQQLAALSSVDDPRAKAMADVVKAQLQELTKRYVVGRSLVTGDNQVLYQAPEPAQTTSPAEQERLANERKRLGLEERRVVALENRLKESGVPGVQLSKKEMQVRDAAFPKATVAVKAFEADADEMIDRLTRLRNHPGLESITGLVYGHTPSVTEDGRAAEVLYNTIIAKGGFQALNDVRLASPTGGALGAVSNQEGKQLKEAFSEINRIMDASDVQAAIDRTIQKLTASKSRVREGYDLTYEYRTSTAPTTPPPTNDAEFIGFE